MSDAAPAAPSVPAVGQVLRAAGDLADQIAAGQERANAALSAAGGGAVSAPARVGAAAAVAVLVRARLRQPSTWAGLIAAGAALLGLTIADADAERIAQGLVVLVGLYEMVRNEASKRA